MDGPPQDRDLKKGRERLAAGAVEPAAQAFLRVLEADPDHADALHLLGVTRMRQGRDAEGLDLLVRAVGAAPTHVPALLTLATALRTIGENEPAAQCLRQVVAVQPGHDLAVFNLGNIELGLGRIDAAIGCYRRALEIRPDQPAVLTNLGVALGLADQTGLAIEALERARILAPASLETLRNLGLLLLAAGRSAEAADTLAAAMQADPGRGDLLRPLALAQQQAGRHQEAETSFQHLALIQPEDAAHPYNEGVAVAAQRRPDDAVPLFRRALALAPGLAAAHANLGVCLRETGDIAGAIEAFDAALRIDPGDAYAMWNRSLSLLSLGRYPEGWPGFERRRELPAFRQQGSRTSLPRWQGEDLAGRRLLVQAEQGFGDTIQMARFLPRLRARAADLVIEVQPALAPLLRAQPDAPAIVAEGGDLPACDVQCSMLSLPGLLGVTLETLGEGGPYLEPPVPQAAVWHDRLPAGRRIGMVWAGNPSHQGDPERSIAPARFAALSLGHEAVWVSLQRELTEAGRAALDRSPHILPLGGGLADFAETAALIAALDLVITVDTSVAHLAGALGKPVWILLPFYADWRWLTDRDDSPWYRAARLFRQPRRGDWDDVFARLSEALKAFLEP